MNISELDDAEANDLRILFEEVRNDVERTFGQTSSFEHGARYVGSTIGCGVDQAHLHIVPVSFEDLLHEVIPDANWVASKFLLPCDMKLSGLEYLWMADRKRSFVAHPDEPVSQFFRRAVAKIAGVERQWDYRTDPFHEHIAETHRVLGRSLEPPKTRAA